MKPTAREQVILDAYEEWDPNDTDDDRSVSEVAQAVGVSRQRLYQVLAKHDIQLKTGPRSQHGLSSSSSSEAVIGQLVLDKLLVQSEEILHLRAELAEYRRVHGDLDALGPEDVLP
jgi:transposase-like protein